MPFVACPSCGERGKIPPTLVGARIKCKKCGVAFNVAASAAKPAAVAAGEISSTKVAMPVAGDGGIAVEGLDDSAWTSAGEAPSDMFKAAPEPHPAEAGEAHAHAHPHAFEPHEAAGTREYKVICSRDKIFEGKFDLPRLEEVLNHFARQGWTVKSMTTPHLKGFGDALKEEIVILLER